MFSPSDLNAFLECEHLAALERTVERPPRPVVAYLSGSLPFL